MSTIYGYDCLRNRFVYTHLKVLIFIAGFPFTRLVEFQIEATAALVLGYLAFHTSRKQRIKYIHFFSGKRQDKPSPRRHCLIFCLALSSGIAVEPLYKYSLKKSFNFSMYNEVSEVSVVVCFLCFIPLMNSNNSYH